VYSSESSASFVRCLITSGLSKTPFSTAKNLNCLNLENEFSPTLSRSKFAISFLIRVLSSDFVVFFLVPVTEYAKNPDTYDANIEVLKAQPDISYQNRQLVDRIAKSYRTKKKTTKSEDNTLIKKEIANF
jgi:hypothetical protein